MNEFISKHMFALMEIKVCVKVTICQHRSTVVWVDCAKMTCCIGFFFFFFFVSLSIYMLLYKQRGLWTRVIWNVGARTQSTLFENHKGLGLKLIFVSIKFFKILICEILNQLSSSVIEMKLVCRNWWCVYVCVCVYIRQWDFKDAICKNFYHTKTSIIEKKKNFFLSR